MTEPKPESDPIKAFANHILMDWDRALDMFFTKADEKRQKVGLTDDQVAAALDLGYGEDIADAWREWARV